MRPRQPWQGRGESAARVGAQVTGVPVVKTETDSTLVGILSKKDLSKSGSTVGDIMSTPPVAARPTSTVADAAVLMLKHKVSTSVSQVVAAHAKPYSKALENA